MEAVNPLYARYEQGLDALNAQDWRAPIRFKEIANLLEVPLRLLHRVTCIVLETRWNRELGLEEARKVWEYIAFSCRTVRPPKQTLVASPKRRMSFPRAMERLASIQSWPCSHRILADALHVSRMVPGRYANGADLSAGITREAAEAIVRGYCR